MQPLGKAFMGPPENILLSRNGKMAPFTPRASRHRLPIGELFGNAYKRVAKCEIVANGFRVTGLFPCYKNIFRPYDYLLSSEDKDAAPLNHSALAKISNQPSFSSANFSPFTSAEALRSSDTYQPCAKPEPKAKSSWWNSRENNEFTLQKIF